MINIQLNGNEEKFDSELTVYDLIKSKGLNPDNIVVELNLNIINKTDYENTKIQDKDKLEILRFVGGG